MAKAGTLGVCMGDPRYPIEMTDEDWEMLRNYVRELKAKERSKGEKECTHGEAMMYRDKTCQCGAELDHSKGGKE